MNLDSPEFRSQWELRNAAAAYAGLAAAAALGDGSHVLQVVMPEMQYTGGSQGFSGTHAVLTQESSEFHVAVTLQVFDAEDGVHECTEDIEFPPAQTADEAKTQLKLVKARMVRHLRRVYGAERGGTLPVGGGYAACTVLATLYSPDANFVVTIKAVGEVGSVPRALPRGLLRYVSKHANDVYLAPPDQPFAIHCSTEWMGLSVKSTDASSLHQSLGRAHRGEPGQLYSTLHDAALTRRRHGATHGATHGAIHGAATLARASSVRRGAAPGQNVSATFFDQWQESLSCITLVPSRMGMYDILAKRHMRPAAVLFSVGEAGSPDGHWVMLMGVWDNEQRSFVGTAYFFNSLYSQWENYDGRGVSKSMAKHAIVHNVDTKFIQALDVDRHGSRHTDQCGVYCAWAASVADEFLAAHEYDENKHVALGEAVEAIEATCAQFARHRQSLIDFIHRQLGW
jgi:hypothetical protein